MAITTDVSAPTDETTNRAALAELHERLARAAAGGGPEAQAKQRARGKFPVRERIERVIDPASPFLELSPLAAGGLYEDASPGAGIVTGIGRIGGSATEGMARQPENSARIQTAMIISAALIEGVALFVAVIAFLIQGKITF